MRNIYERNKDDLQRLIELGGRMHADLILRHVNPKKNKVELAEKIAKLSGQFELNYQRWYTEASAVIRQIIPSRLPEFESYYRSDAKRKSINAQTFSIQDWMIGLRAAEEFSGQRAFKDLAAIVGRFKVQCEILSAAQSRFDSSLFDIRQILQADLFDSELEKATELLKKGFGRAAGVIAGVVVEKHLIEACKAHGVTPSKKLPTIVDMNDALKASEIVDLPTWRLIQRIGDLRNMAAHGRHEEPTSEQIGEMIDAVARVCKTVY